MANENTSLALEDRHIVRGNEVPKPDVEMTPDIAADRSGKYAVATLQYISSPRARLVDNFETKSYATARSALSLSDRIASPADPFGTSYGDRFLNSERQSLETSSFHTAFTELHSGSLANHGESLDALTLRSIGGSSPGHWMGRQRGPGASAVISRHWTSAETSVPPSLGRQSRAMAQNISPSMYDRPISSRGTTMLVYSVQDLSLSRASWSSTAASDRTANALVRESPYGRPDRDYPPYRAEGGKQSRLGIIKSLCCLKHRASRQLEILESRPVSRSPWPWSSVGVTHHEIAPQSNAVGHDADVRAVSRCQSEAVQGDTTSQEHFSALPSYRSSLTSLPRLRQSLAVSSHDGEGSPASPTGDDPRGLRGAQVAHSDHMMKGLRHSPTAQRTQSAQTHKGFQTIKPHQNLYGSQARESVESISTDESVNTFRIVRTAEGDRTVSKTPGNTRRRSIIFPSASRGSDSGSDSTILLSMSASSIQQCRSGRRRSASLRTSPSILPSLTESRREEEQEQEGEADGVDELLQRELDQLRPGIRILFELSEDGLWIN